MLVAIHSHKDLKYRSHSEESALWVRWKKNSVLGCASQDIFKPCQWNTCVYCRSGTTAINH